MLVRGREKCRRGLLFFPRMVTKGVCVQARWTKGHARFFYALDRLIGNILVIKPTRLLDRILHSGKFALGEEITLIACSGAQVWKPLWHWIDMQISHQ